MCWPYWKAFNTLTESRPLAVGMGAAVQLPIPYSEKSSYAHDHGFADSYADLEEFVDLVGALDRAYLDHVNAEKK